MSSTPDTVGPYPLPSVEPTFGPTPSQTVGPYFSFGLTEPWDEREDAVAPYRTDAIEIFGQVFDGLGEPIPDAMIETWQADPDGRFNHPDDPRGAVPYEGFRGFARSGTDEQGNWRVRTLKPGSIPAADGVTPQAPHIVVTVMARGVLRQLTTRIYFGDEPEANAADPVLQSLPEDARRTLIAEPVEGRGYRFDIHLQGDDETAFFQF
ncbi:MAG: protocatechuate 3,4-dioxygenase subunit alpha [Solirubrobacteraceae bacterium]|nr:protocatechuate 3,4-dioxygenase subunit alpha [Solirubrobacteraceae bacterium]